MQQTRKALIAFTIYNDCTTIGPVTYYNRNDKEDDMMPTNTALKRWHLTMTAMQSLAVTLGTDMEYHNPLLQGMVLTAFHNPLLRMVSIEATPHIAHVTSAFKISICGLDNPLENSSKMGDLRARIYGNLGEMVIERNEGPRYKDEVERSIDSACSRAGNEMMRTEDFTGPAGQKFSSLLPFTLSSHGTAFTWSEVERYNLSSFKQLTIIERAEKYEKEIPTFDILLSF